MTQVITESVEVGQTLGVNADLALAFLELAASGRGQEALDRYGALDFRHHNPFFAGDGESLVRGMDEDARANPGKRLEVMRAISEGPFVALHSRVDQGQGRMTSRRSISSGSRTGRSWRCGTSPRRFRPTARTSTGRSDRRGVLRRAARSRASWSARR